jgi:hypothetical protein
VTTNTDEALQHLSLGLFIFADSTASRPHILLPNKTLPALPDVIFRSFTWRGGGTGWITDNKMAEAASEILIPELEIRRKRLVESGHSGSLRALLLFDGHGSHDTRELFDILADKDVDFAHFLPHSSHLCQPLDVCLFKEFKSHLT